MFEFIKNIFRKHKEKQFEKETKSIIDDMLAINNYRDIRHITFKVDYKDEKLAGNFFDKIKELGETYSDSRLSITPSLNLTDRLNGPKTIGIRIKWKF